jgi:WD40 repeat protein
MRPDLRLLSVSVVLFMLIALSFAGGKAAAQDDYDPITLGIFWERDDGHNATLWSVSWSPNGTMISTTYFDNTTVVWEAATGRRIIKLGTHPNHTAEPEGTRCWGSSECQLNKTVSHWPSRTSSWSPDGKYLAVGGDNRLIMIYDTTDWSLHKVLQGHDGSVLTVEWSPDGSLIASGSGTDKVGMHNVPENLIKIWDFGSGNAVATLSGHLDGVMNVRWSTDGSTLVSASDDKTLRMWNTTTWNSVMNLTGHTIGVLSADWSPNGTMLVSGSRDYSVMVWNLSSGESTAKWSAPNCQRSVDWHPAGELIAASGPAESLLRIRNATSGTVLKTFEEAAETGSDVMSSKWSPDGTMLAAGSGKEHTLRVYKFGIATPPPPPLIPEWLPGTILFFALSTVGTILICWHVYRKLIRMRREEGPK